ncbi:VOC family protein [Parasphingopyxis algicola]|uniref:VOC family protein n=1 Tax=Parasphingopyxis algicola TaxID=2026624 RepID=UPI0015A3EB40|nr:VOC family protein [Parasphingopyxis algicola]QLC25960.1 VOC family protein [Parasphingopyxis algicola]
MAYHHLALAAKDMKAIHDFYEGVMGFELVKVEIAPVMGGGWGKHFFYRMDADDSRFIAFWELHDVPGQADQVHDLNAAAKMPQGTNHYSFAVDTRAELDGWRERWNDAGRDVLEIDHNWCRSVYTRDPNGNMIEFCLTTGEFTEADRERALAALDETEMQASPPPGSMKNWPAG